MFLCGLAGTTLDAHAQSFGIAISPDESAGSSAVAGRPHLMTITRDGGSGTDAGYTGAHALEGLYIHGADSASAVAPQICVPNVGETCAPGTGTCQTATAAYSALSFPLTFASGVAKFCVVMPDVGKFSVGLREAGVEGIGPELTARPDHFTLAGVALTNRNELGACVGPTFTYMGEPIGVTFQLTARNRAGATTANYAGPFVRFANDITSTATWTTHGANDSMGLWMVATGHAVGAGTCTAMFSDATPSVTSYACTGVADPAPINRAAGPRVTISPTPAAPTANWANGVGTYTVNVVLERADVRDGAYSTLRIGIAPRDADGIGLNPSLLNLDADNNAVNERAALAQTKLRYGRLKISNAFGSELLPLPVAVQAQFWNGSAYISNTDDGCTPLAGASFSAVHAQGEAISPIAVSAVGSLTGGTGRGVVTLAKPTFTGTVGKTAVNITATAPVYLPSTTGRATFGVYKGGPVIYRRELHY